MSKFLEYKTIYLDEEHAKLQFPDQESPKAGYYVLHPRKTTMGPYVDKEHALRYIEVEICHDIELEKNPPQK